AGPPDIFLIIEMADSSLEYDETLKARLYAETGVAEYWIADVRNDRLLVYSDLRNNSYAACRELRRGEVISPALLPDCRIAVNVLLP
ncbi:MAG TPA: Uma2 family endonuclease, partial [Terriglobia bacterium]|nr:Uma2 family endonuclease [Terriglobia bacterium]